MKSRSPDATTIDDYIQGFPRDVQAILSKLRWTVSRAAPRAVEKISYGMPTFFYNGNLVHFAAYEHHIGFYPTPSAITEFQSDLKKYKSAKGSVQFPIDEPLPLRLIARMVKFRATQNARKEPARPRRRT